MAEADVHSRHSHRTRANTSFMANPHFPVALQEVRYTSFAYSYATWLKGCLMYAIKKRKRSAVALTQCLP
jgi:hypothetical protein